MTGNTSIPPKTLLEISGAALRPSPLAESVLVLVDAQNEYVCGKLPLAGIAQAIAEASCLLASARANGIPVIHIVHVTAQGRPVFAPGSHGAQIVPELTPLPSEEVIEKTLPNAFAGTVLGQRLEGFAAMGRKSIILAGFMTHNCISSTARAALDRGIPATIVASATATRALPDLCGGVIAAEIVQAAALAGLADRSAAVVLNLDALATTRRCIPPSMTVAVTELASRRSELLEPRACR